MRGSAVLHCLGLAVVAAVACTDDFSTFDTSGKAHGGAAMNGDGATGPDAGSSGTASGGNGGNAGNAGTAGEGGVAGASAGASGTSTGGGSAGAQPADSGADGRAPDAARPDGSAGASGSGGTDGGAADGGLTDGGACSSTEKLCASACVPMSPSNGCGASACDPCALTNVNVQACSTGACSVGTCATGFGDCNVMAADGCERVVQNDTLNCGSCDRACSNANTEARVCSGNQCTSTCPVGRANCGRPASGADDGCETPAATDPANCGGCSNRCAMQGVLGCSNSLCGCTANAECRQGSGAATLTCDTATGLCHCDTAVCAHGETCLKAGTCQCNGGRACAAGRTCCQTPAGCIDLMTNESSCGACGRACPPGFVCVAGGCQCNGNDDCNAGTAGTCTAGLCQCGGVACAKGQRCLGNGQCG